MRIATWNVNGIRARLGFLLHWLRERQPDLVALQELKTADEAFPHAELLEAGYHAAVFGQKGWNGVALLGREPLQIVERGLPGQEACGSRLLTVESQGLAFTSLYAPNGKTVTHADFPMKLAWYDALIAHVGGRGRLATPTLLGGDFNLCPAAIDSWNEAMLAGSIFHTREERSRFDALIALGFRDLYREIHPAGREYTWWDYRAGAFHKQQGLRIDFLLGSPQVRERVRAVTIDRDYRKKKDDMIPSDHAPVIATLER